MLFKYTSVDKDGSQKDGTIDAYSEDSAIASLQRRGLVISSIELAEKKGAFDIAFLERVSNKEIVIASRQIATLFEAQVSALKVFRLMSEEMDNPLLKRTLVTVADDLQGGSSISKAIEKHPKVFTKFYVNMVRAGEEAGKLDETFIFLADYLDRTYEVTSKARNALIYPAFVISTFIVVMILMLTLVIPRISTILIEAGQEIPVYTQVVIGISNFFINYGLFLLILIIVGGVFLWRYSRTGRGKLALDDAKMAIPFVGTLYRKLYLSRISDNLSTMLTSGISMVESIEITATVVGNAIYEDLLTDVAEQVRGGSSVSEALSGNEEIPGIMLTMIKVGEETGELGSILKTLSKFYRREVTNAVDTLITLIEPIMIVTLGLGVGFLLASVLIPIYNVSTAI